MGIIPISNAVFFFYYFWQWMLRLRSGEHEYHRKGSDTRFSQTSPALQGGWLRTVVFLLLRRVNHLLAGGGKWKSPVNLVKLSFEVGAQLTSSRFDVANCGTNTIKTRIWSPKVATVSVRSRCAMVVVRSHLPKFYTWVLLSKYRTGKDAFHGRKVVKKSGNQPLTAPWTMR